MAAAASRTWSERRDRSAALPALCGVGACLVAILQRLHLPDEQEADFRVDLEGYQYARRS